jgi:hypothetical protein
MTSRVVTFVCFFSVAARVVANDELSLLQVNAKVLEEFDDFNFEDAVAETAQEVEADFSETTDEDGELQFSEEGIVRLLDFTKATLVHNNLGGQGPEKTLPNGNAAPEELRYRNLVEGKAIDLVVTTDAGYEAWNPSRNGILGGNGQINAKSGTRVPLTFKFVDQGTNNLHVMPKFYMTFSDLDERHGGKEMEKLQVTGFDRYYTNDDLSVVGAGSDSPTFQSADFGDYEDNNFSPDSPSPTQLSHAVTFLFTNKASFEAVYTIESQRQVHKGRNILFSGISQLVFCQEESTYLNFTSARITSNNLGGKGPWKNGANEMRYADIGITGDGQILDLVVTTAEPFGYIPWNTSQNGLHGEFGQFNLFCGPTRMDSTAFVTFTIVKTGTNEPVVLEQFAFAVFDFDTGHDEQQVEYVEILPNGVGFEGGSGYSSYILTPSTEIVISEGKKGRVKFSATKHGTVHDNPMHPQNLARETADKTIVFTFRKTSSFSALFGITPTGQDTGRNFMFSGQDMYLMCD